MGSVWNLSLSDIMSKKVMTLNESDSVEFAIKMFDCSHISGSPVMNDSGDCIGVVSRTDLLSRKVLDWVNAGNSLNTLPIKEIMTSGAPITISDSSSVVDAVRVMQKKKIHRVFIDDSNEEIVGVVSTYDILNVVDLIVSGEIQRNEESNQLLNHIVTPISKGQRLAEKNQKENDGEDHEKNGLEERIETLITQKQKELFGTS